MSKANENQQLKEKLLMICNKIEAVLLEFKEIKEKYNNMKTEQIFFNDSNSKINTINKLKQKIISLQNNLENVYNINNINKIESEIKKKITSLKKLSEEQTLLNNLIKSQKKDIDDYYSKFTDNKEINQVKSKLIIVKEENRIKKDSFILLNSKIKGQMSKIDVLEKQLKIIKQNIEYQKNKQKKEVEKSLNSEDGETNEDNQDSFALKEKILISEIAEDEKNFQIEIVKQHELIQKMKDKIIKLIEYKNKIKETKKKEKLKKIKLIKYKSNDKNLIIKNPDIISYTSQKSLDYNTKINKTNKFGYKYGESPKNSSGFNNIHIKLNKKPFNIIKFNEIYKDFIGQNKNKNPKNENNYKSFYERNEEIFKKENRNLSIKQKQKNKISNDIENLRNEITFALKNNVVFLNSPTNKDGKNLIYDEKINLIDINKDNSRKNSNKPFEKFNFS